MTPLFLISLVIQVLLIVHCIRTGRNTIWIMALAFLPWAGPIAYVIVEILPELMGSRGTRRAMRGVRRALDPSEDLRRLESEARIKGGVAALQRYADELVRQHREAEAVGVYRQAMTGLYEHDPNLMLGLARAQFAQEQPAEASATLEELIARNPGFKSAEGHLLYARALEGAGNVTKALEEYQVLTGYFAGAEAPVRHAQLLRAQGRGDEARKILSALLEHARHAPRHYRKAQQQWLDTATAELAKLQA